MERPQAPTKTVGPVSARLLFEVQKKGKSLFTLGEALRLTHTSYPATASLLAKLVRRGVVARIKTGTYLILRAGSEDAQLKNWPIIARELAGKDPHFISHYSAMRLHGMTSHPLLEIHITVLKRKKPKQVSGITYRFIFSKKDHFWGKSAHWVTRQDQIQVSDLERTILDGFDRPDLCGGLAEVVRGLWAKQKEIDHKKLWEYARSFRTKAAVKRLGFILETLQGASPRTSVLSAHVAKAKDYVLLDPQGPKAGKHLSRWRLRLNANLEELKAGVWG
jgi:predicted transcriptional regulator of viral defense system